MRTLAGPDSHVYFTHLSPSSGAWLEEKFTDASADAKLAKASVHQKGVMDILEPELCTSLERVCLLDPKAREELKPEDGDGRFDCFLFGVSRVFPTCSGQEC